MPTGGNAAHVAHLARQQRVHHRLAGRDARRIAAEAMDSVVAVAAPDVVCLHGVGRSGRDWDGVRTGLERYGVVHTPDLLRATPAKILAGLADLPADVLLVGHSLGAVVALAHAATASVSGLVLTSSFFPPARNGRSRAATLRDYGTHRVAVVRELSERGVSPRPRTSTGRAMGALARLGLRPGSFHALCSRVRAPVLVLHGRQDHYVPVDFAMAGVARHPAWTVKILDGGHDIHVDHPVEWLRCVESWHHGQ